MIESDPMLFTSVIFIYDKFKREIQGDRYAECTKTFSPQETKHICIEIDMSFVLIKHISVHLSCKYMGLIGHENAVSVTDRC